MPKFNFVPEHQLAKIETGNGFWTISILGSKASPTIYFPSDMVSALEMDGKYIQIFADTEKKVIGWRLIKDKTAMADLNNARIINKNSTTGAATLGIGKIMKILNYDMKETLKKLRVETYVSPLVAGEISYVKLPQVFHKPEEVEVV